MKKLFKRTLAIFLAVVMTLGTAPLAGFVGLELPEFSGFKNIADSMSSFFDGFIAKAEAATSGICGENLTWLLNAETGVLTISGTGKMYDWEYGFAPWYSNRAYIKKVTIGNSVTSIGMSAFKDCDSITSIEIPDSVTSIGNCAFAGCPSLTSVKIGNNVKNIGLDAFYNTGYFNKTSNWENGVLYIGKYLIGVNKSITGSYEIKDGTLVITNGAFSHSSFTSVTIPNSVTSIVGSMFFECYNLISVRIPDSVTSIGAYAFAGCSSLTSIEIPDGVTSIGNRAFWVCDSLISITVDSENTAYSSDEYNVLFNKNKTSLIQYPTGNTRTSYSVPNSVTSIGDEAFYFCDCLTSITIPDSVAYIGEYAFWFCDRLTDVYYAGTDAQWKAISIGSYNTSLTNATIHFNCSPEGGETPPVEDDYLTQNIKVMSYNVYVGNEVVNGYDCSHETRLRYIIQSINDNMPDSIGFQEVTSDMRFMLENYEDLNGGILAANYEGVGDYRGSKDYKGIKINSEASPIYYNKNKFTLEKEGTFWLSESGKKNSIHSKAKYPRVCTYALLKNKETGLEYLHVNTHIEHDYTGKDEINSNEAAIFSSKKIIDFINNNFPNVPVVITGDFNQKKDSVPYNNFINAGYTDTRNVYSGNVNTYSNCYKGGGGSVIDHIFVNDYFADGINSYKVYNEDYSNSAKYGKFALDYPYPSDHHPVVVELKVPYFLSKEIEFDENKTVEVEFMDIWFEKSNEVYNHKLAQFCADYVMMGYCEDKNKMETYLKEMGFDTIDCCMAAGRDEVNYFIANKKITVNGKTETLVFAAFIGSYKDQWYSNFDPYGTQRDNWKDRNAPYADASEKGKVHLGFADAREYVYARLKKYIKDNNINKENMKLLLSGHSRGAATANLLAAKLINELKVDTKTATVYNDDIYTYTFATPNTALTSLGTQQNSYKKIFNIVNPEDFVTKVMLKYWGFGRYGTTYTLPSKENDDNYKSYLKNMKTLFENYTGKNYDPYKMGELKTYKIINLFEENVDTLNGLYEDKFVYRLKSITDGFEYKSPFEFFKRTLLKYLVDEDMDEIIDIALTCSTFYKEIIMYFAWPDADLNASVDKVYNLLLQPNIEIGGKFKQAHQMETYAAYMNSMTENQIKQYREAYKNTVNCPVNIEVYNNTTNELVGKITNNIIDETVAAKENAIVMDVDGDSKSFWLPSNGDYRIVLTGNDEGIMDYSVSSIDSDTGETQRVNFFDIEIENEVSMEGEIKSAKFELVEYTLTHEKRGAIKPTEKLEGDELKDITIAVTAEGVGYTDGNITVTSGDYVTLTATTNEGNSFTGWYENGVLISGDAEYSFVAKENRNLVAKFTNNRTIQWNVDGETTVTYCKEGKKITAPANPKKEGYKFVGWTPEIPDVMPANDLTFTAVFDAEKTEHPSEPTTKPVVTVPAVTVDIRTPSQTEITYGDSIILHADVDKVPEGGKIVWTADNGNFSYTVSADGSTCTITPESSGDTTFTVTVYDAKGNEISKDTQTMTSKAGFFQKIIAFFKKLFGMTKVIPEAFKGIF